MKPREFVRKWGASQLKESAAYQEHLLDICRLLAIPTPAESDPTGDLFTFEKGAEVRGGNGFADVWHKGRFAWEYKGRGRDLNAAYEQVLRYREALENPPLLIVCDFELFEIHTNWTNTETWVWRFSNADIASGEAVQVTAGSSEAQDAPQMTALDVLRAVFTHPELLRPRKSRDDVTRAAAVEFGAISDDLRKYEVDEHEVAQFLCRVVFCMFATDIALLPRETFSEIVRVGKENKPEVFQRDLRGLFDAMNTGGRFGLYRVPEFDGRLFDAADVPDKINGQHIRWIEHLDKMNWADVEPSIFGTLFERVIDPNQRKKLGAHYTSRADIELIVEPVLMEPLRHAWSQVRTKAANVLSPAGREPNAAEKRQATNLLAEFQRRLSSIRVLDPACGSGNFLYVSLALLKALEKEIVVFGDLYGIALDYQVHPRQLAGIETNPFAQMLASIVIWIGYLQWKKKNGIDMEDELPIMEPWPRSPSGMRSST